jgi:hypothetical protein
MALSRPSVPRTRPVPRAGLRACRAGASPVYDGAYPVSRPVFRTPAAGCWPAFARFPHGRPNGRPFGRPHRSRPCSRSADPALNSAWKAASPSLVVSPSRRNGPVEHGDAARCQHLGDPRSADCTAGLRRSGAGGSHHDQVRRVLPLRPSGCDTSSTTGGSMFSAPSAAIHAAMEARCPGSGSWVTRERGISAAKRITCSPLPDAISSARPLGRSEPPESRARWRRGCAARRGPSAWVAVTPFAHPASVRHGRSRSGRSAATMSGRQPGHVPRSGPRQAGWRPARSGNRSRPGRRPRQNRGRSGSGPRTRHRSGAKVRRPAQLLVTRVTSSVTKGW